MQSLDTSETIVKWGNKDNNAFYEAVKADGLNKLASKAGLVSGCDLNILAPYWFKAKSILEVGAGYGRVMDYLLEHQFTGAITAIERCNVLFEYLARRFDQYKDIKLIHGDILNLSNLGHFDLILMLWSSIADFLPEEQILIFKKLRKLLNKQGKFIIDTLPESVVPLNSERSNGQRVFKQEINNTAILTYSMSLEEVDNAGHLAGFCNISREFYYTDTNRQRILHILE